MYQNAVVTTARPMSTYFFL